MEVAVRALTLQIDPLAYVRKFVLLLLCVGFAATAALAGETPYKPRPSHYYCTSSPATKTRYYSGIFEVPGKGVDYQQISNGFAQFLAQKYGVTGDAVCFGDPDQNTVRTKVQKEIVQLRAVNWTTVQTSWTYNGAPAAPLPPPPPKPTASAVNGVYVGSYICAKGPTDLRLTLTLNENSMLNGTFTFYLPPGSHTKAYSFSLGGPFDQASGKFNLYPSKWETPAPPNFMMVGLKGAYDGGKVSGTVDYTGCGKFEAMKGRDE